MNSSTAHEDFVKTASATAGAYLPYKGCTIGVSDGIARLAVR